MPLLPSAPSPDELARHTPRIAPVPPGTARPLWSVMMPNHNGGDYLRIALESVLCQDPGPDRMQIEVVDDRSTSDDPADVIDRIGPGRITLHRNETNLGATSTFNVCLARSRGEWVHVLHSDDAVLPGFYAECEAAIRQHPSIVMIIGQIVMVDEHGRWTTLTGPAPSQAGSIVTDFPQQQAVAQLGQFAGVVVRRDAYERAGGFCTFFGHVADRDMWFRIGQLGPVWCTSRPYGLYRVHSGADTGKHMVRGTNIEETYVSTCLSLARLGASENSPYVRGWRDRLSRLAYRNARKLSARGVSEGAFNQARWAFRLRPNPKTFTLMARAWMATGRRG